MSELPLCMYTPVHVSTQEDWSVWHGEYIYFTITRRLPDCPPSGVQAPLKSPEAGVAYWMTGVITLELITARLMHWRAGS